jgi:hypothetical protein
VQSFSDCHAGIVARLAELGRLPALAAAAAQARSIAADAKAFVRDVVLTHHADEEQELFPAVVAGAQHGDELDKVQAIVGRLTREHRHIEAAWHELEPVMRDLAAGRDTVLEARRLAAFVAEYKAHADYEEKVFLPLASTILGRDSNHMAALGLSLHARHAMPEVLRRFGTHL